MPMANRLHTNSQVPSNWILATMPFVPARKISPLGPMILDNNRTIAIWWSLSCVAWLCGWCLMGNCTDIEDTGILVYINAFEKVYRHLKYHFIKSFYVLIEITILTNRCFSKIRKIGNETLKYRDSSSCLWE